MMHRNMRGFVVFRVKEPILVPDHALQIRQLEFFCLANRSRDLPPASTQFRFNRNQISGIFFASSRRFGSFVSRTSTLISNVGRSPSRAVLQKWHSAASESLHCQKIYIKGLCRRKFASF
jgi:hypothetical protein